MAAPGLSVAPQVRFAVEDLAAQRQVGSQSRGEGGTSHLPTGYLGDMAPSGPAFLMGPSSLLPRMLRPARLPCCHWGGGRSPVTTKEGFLAEALCGLSSARGAVGLPREGDPEPCCTAHGLVRAISQLCFSADIASDPVCWSYGQHPSHTRGQTRSLFKNGSCSPIPIGIKMPCSSN